MCTIDALAPYDLMCSYFFSLYFADALVSSYRSGLRSGLKRWEEMRAPTSEIKNTLAVEGGCSCEKDCSLLWLLWC